MSKIVQAVNAMISHENLINKVVPNGNEYFFLYKNKYCWSITKKDDNHIIWFYPGQDDVGTLASLEGPEDWDRIAMVSYRDAEIGTKEAKASFADLYTTIKERAHGVNEVLDDIISDNDPF